MLALSPLASSVLALVGDVHDHTVQGSVIHDACDVPRNLSMTCFGSYGVRNHVYLDIGGSSQTAAGSRKLRTKLLHARRSLILLLIVTCVCFPNMQRFFARVYIYCVIMLT